MAAFRRQRLALARVSWVRGSNRSMSLLPCKQSPARREKERGARSRNTCTLARFSQGAVTGARYVSTTIEDLSTSLRSVIRCSCSGVVQGVPVIIGAVGRRRPGDTAVRSKPYLRRKLPHRFLVIAKKKGFCKDISEDVDDRTGTSCSQEIAGTGLPSEERLRVI